mgnify:CR=1 FL=1
MTVNANDKPIRIRHHVANVVKAPSAVRKVTLKKSTNASPTPVKNVMMVDTIAPTAASITTVTPPYLFIGICA